MSFEQANDIIISGMGSQFDPTLKGVMKERDLN